MKHTKHRLSFEPVFFYALFIERFEEEKGDTHVLPDSIHPRAAPCSARTRPEGISQNIEIRRINRSGRRWTKGVPAFFFLVLTKYEKYLRISHSFRFKKRMTFFTTAINTLQTCVVALGAGYGAWGVINLLEGYGSDNPGAKSQGIKQLMAGAAVALFGTTVIPILATLF